MGTTLLNIWDRLSTRSSLAFGRECLSASLWMFVCLCTRATIFLLRLSDFIPYGLIFAMPYITSKFSNYFKISEDIFPLLPVRLAECIMGRISQARLSVVIPAHFIGCVFAAVLFKLVSPLGWIHTDALAPLSTPSTLYNSLFYKIVFVLIEAICTCLYVIVILIAPDILTINRIPKYWTTLLTIPLFLLSVNGFQPSFHPAANYAIWYTQDSVTTPNGIGAIYNKDTCLAQDPSSDIFCNATAINILNSTIASTNVHAPWLPSNPLQIERIVGPFIGAVVAGLVCASYFPDDESSWKSRAKKVE